MIIDAISGVGGGGGGTTIVQKPTVSVGTYTYDGTAQGPTITGFDSSKMTISGDTATNAGSYTLTIGLKNTNSMVWNDMTTADLTWSWSIAKADQTITLSSNSVTLDFEHLTASVTVSGAEGAISVSSSDSTVATASVSGSTITVSNVNQKTGSATITVSVAGTTNYNPATDSTISVTASFTDFLSDWLTAGGLTPSSYADLDAVLADEVAIRRLFTIHDAVDVIVDEVADIASADLTKIFNNNYVAKWINLRDYALDTLYANNTIAGYMDTADKYFYGEWVITDSTTTPVTWGAKGNVPVMTSNTAPYGEASCYKLNSSGGDAYLVFDGNDSTWVDQYYGQSGTPTTQWIQYKFTNPQCIRAVSYRLLSQMSVPTYLTGFKVQASNDGSTFVDIATFNDLSGYTQEFLSFSNNVAYMYWRIQATTTSSGRGVMFCTLQFYGREMKASVPILTSSSDEVFSSPSLGANNPGWKAFNGSTSISDAFFTDTTTQDNYVGYDFKRPVIIKTVEIITANDSNYGNLCYSWKFQGSNDKSTWTTLYEESQNTDEIKVRAVTNTTAYRYYRVANMIHQFDLYGNLPYAALHAQFFGLDYFEYDWDTDNPRHYIYDHGVELETITTSTSGSKSIEKRSDSIYMMGDSSSYLGAQVTSIDLTNYSLFRVVIGKIYGGNSHSLGVDGNNTTYVMLPDSGINPNNLSLDIENVNSTHQIVITGDTGTSSIGYLDFVEWWLE